MKKKFAFQKPSFSFALVSGGLALLFAILCLIAPVGEAFKFTDKSGAVTTYSSAYEVIFGLAVTTSASASKLAISAFPGIIFTGWLFTLIGTLLLVGGYLLIYSNKPEKVGFFFAIGAILLLLGGIFAFLARSQGCTVLLPQDASKEDTIAFRKGLAVGTGFLLSGISAVLAALLALMTPNMMGETVKSARKRNKDYFQPEGIEKEMLRYRENGISGTLGYLGLILDAVAFCIIYSTTSISTSDEINVLGITSSGVLAGIDVALNIFMILFLFLAITEMKAYSKGWGIFTITQGIFQVVRPFIYPLAMLKDDILSKGIFTATMILFIASGVCFIIAGVLSILRGKILRDYLATVKPIENERGGK